MSIASDVNDIRARALARQAAENPSEINCSNLDRVSSGRGAPSGCDATFAEIALQIGLGDAPYPAQSVSKISKKAIKSFVHNYVIMTISQSVKCRHMFEKSRIEYSARVYANLLAEGLSDIDILKKFVDMTGRTDSENMVYSTYLETLMGVYDA